MTQSVLLRVTFLTVYLFTNTHSPQYSHLLLITSYINSLIILQSVAFLKESQLSQVNLSWMFNWDLFRQCDSWKKKSLFTNTLLSQGRWKKQQMSFLFLLPVPLHHFCFSLLLLFLHFCTYGLSTDLAARAANRAETVGGLQALPVLQGIWHGLRLRRGSD